MAITATLDFDYLVEAPPASVATLDIDYSVASVPSITVTLDLDYAIADTPSPAFLNLDYEIRGVAEHGANRVFHRRRSIAI